MNKRDAIKIKNRKYKRGDYIMFHDPFVHVGLEVELWKPYKVIDVKNGYVRIKDDSGREDGYHMLSDYFFKVVEIK